ncbi:MAG: acyl-CoA dehydrogenase family protein [Sphingomicrobium sp.]
MTATDEHPLVTAAHIIARDVLRPHAEDVDQRERYPDEGLAALVATGICGMTVPAAYGGHAVDARTAVAILEALAWGCPSTAALMLTWGGSILSIAEYGSDAQKDHILPGVAAGTVSLSFALTEPHAGSDAGAISSSAVRDGDGWRLNGRKVWIGNAARADIIVCAVKTDPAAVSRGISSFLIEKGTPGVSVPELYSKMGARGTLHGDLLLDDVHLPATALLGTEGRGFAQMMHSLDFVRLITAAHAIGIARAAYDAAVDRARTRTAFGRPIGQHQGLGFILADMATQLEAARALTLSAAAKLDSGQPIPREAAMAKLFATEAATRIAHQAQQVFGAEGCRSGALVERMYREARITEIWDGTSEIQRLVIARSILGREA